ncbi:orotidine 5'-phosphate decarboxylase [Campylobacter pinnipediorum subsp. caledonicus]|uniref:orotidine-5'-phosphate decarboxylase n=1 Tax=Campylobacter pinnipediorum TaxID=1965231 RepID=UPI000994D2AA|nr:orotidine-5'-phosphate decarboxylase [Campylobacter pinnipediorum]AQW85331.1 orotidine-5'-phosphate decarboxylase [Campylobacter pinnipediorum subsp. caledonicus]OPA71931.1 orotidine 5'-phosphate decarboxylase [Campylobacter pinnipediorum subsp. caledonicus]
MKLCVALDMQSLDENLNLARGLNGLDIWMKVGLRSYLRDGALFLTELKKMNFKIFLDLKLHDIPNTMADAAEVIADLGIDMTNIHASAGKRAMSEVANRLSVKSSRPLLFAVSALTSFSQDEFFDVYNEAINNSVRKFSIDAYECGLDGMVCSVFESKLIKQSTSNSFLTLTPGIRPFKESSDDQNRVADINTAKENLSDFIVVGRPIYKSDNPRMVVEKILSEI